MDNASVWRARGPEIESHKGQEFFILKFSLFSRATQLDNAIANEINRGIHLANTLFSLGILCIYWYTWALMGQSV